MTQRNTKEKSNPSTALVVQSAKTSQKKQISILSWAAENIDGESLADVNEVKNRLPVILGKILALCWLNEDFQTLFLENPSASLLKFS